MKPVPSFNDVADRELLIEVKRLAADERQATAALVASLAEVDSRRLYLGEGCSSLFTYCTQALHLTEHAAYERIAAARAGRRFALVLDLLAAGDVTLTAVTLLAPHLTDENHRFVLASARHKSKRDVEQIVAGLHPRPDVAAIVRKLPSPTPPAASRPAVLELLRTDGDPDGQTPAREVATDACAVPTVVSREAAVRPPVVAPLAPERYKVQFTVGRETYDRLRRAQDLLRHVVPNGDLAGVFDRALTVLVAHLERQKLAATARPRRARSAASKGRRLPAAVRRAVWRRDDGRCAFAGSAERCTETGHLEFHHVVPFARGGAATVENIQLRCRAHNQYEAVEAFGPHVLLVRETAAQYESPGPRTRSGPSYRGRDGIRWRTDRSPGSRQEASSSSVMNDELSA